MRLPYLFAVLCVTPLLAVDDLEPILRDWPVAQHWQRPASGSDAKSSERAANSSPLSFVATTPCRILDTRPNAPANQKLVTGPISASQAVSVPVRTSTCGVPSTAVAYSLNFTVDATLNNIPVGFLSAWPAGNQPAQLVSIINAPLGGFVANAAIVPAGTNGAIEIFASNPTHVVIDINGYFTDALSTDAPAAVYSAPTINWPAILCLAVPTVRRMDYSIRDLDTHNAVTTGQEWTFTAPRDGLYSLTATTSGNVYLEVFREGPLGSAQPATPVRRAPSTRPLIGPESHAIVSSLVSMRAGERLYAVGSNTDGCPFTGYFSIHYVRPRP